MGGDDEHRDLGDDVGHHDAGELGGEEEGHQGGGAHGQETHDEVFHYSLYNQQKKCYKTMFRHIFENMSLSVLCCIDMYCSL